MSRYVVQEEAIFRRRTIADFHMIIEVLWMGMNCYADSKDNFWLEMVVVATFVTGVFASRLLVLAIDFHKILVIPASLLTLALLFPRCYVFYQTFVWEKLDFTRCEHYGIWFYTPFVFIILFHIWFIVEYMRAYELITREKEAAALAEEERVESDAAWRYKQKLRKRAMRRKRREEKRAALLLAQGTAVEEEEDRPSTSQAGQSHEHYYVDETQVHAENKV